MGNSSSQPSPRPRPQNGQQGGKGQTNRNPGAANPDQAWPGNPHGRQLNSPKGGKGPGMGMKGKGKAGPMFTQVDQKAEQQRQKIKSMHDQVAVLTRKREQLDLEISQCQRDAEEKIRRGDQAAAKRALARKKAKLNQATTTDNSLMTLENQINAIDATMINVDLVQSLKTGNEIQQQIQNDMNPDMVADIMDTQQELQDQLEEMNQIIGQNVEGLANDMDEEMEALQQQIADEKAIEMNKQLVGGAVASADVTPAVPSQPVSIPGSGVPTSMPAEMAGGSGGAAPKDELAALEAELGL